MSAMDSVVPTIETQNHPALAIPMVSSSLLNDHHFLFDTYISFNRLNPSDTYFFFFFSPTSPYDILVYTQGTFKQVMLIIDETTPLVECTFLFGSTQVHCSSRFPLADVQTVIQMATNIMLASKDHQSTLKINDRLVLGILLPAAQTLPDYPIDLQYGLDWRTSFAHQFPGMHHSVVSVLEEEPMAFVVGQDQWEIGIHFQFGSQIVTFTSQFESHLIPDAMIIARDICGSLGYWDPDSQGHLIEPLENPYYFNRVLPAFLFPPCFI
jgi:hypothetical protein